MLKFIRSLRRKIIDKGSVSRYLIYAIGEIILVVIGILIALQINNSNEARKNNRIEYQYLIRLKAEFESSLQEPNETYRYTNEYQRLSELLLKVISTDYS